VNSEFFFEPSSKLRKGFPSETRVKRGFPRDPLRERTLREAPAGMISVRGRRFQEVLHANGTVRRRTT
jgi:hypothetical protein